MTKALLQIGVFWLFFVAAVAFGAMIAGRQ
jgi:hypothetical protein